MVVCYKDTQITLTKHKKQIGNLSFLLVHVLYNIKEDKLEENK